MSLTLKSINFLDVAKEAVNLGENTNDLLRSIDWDKKYLWKVKFLPALDSFANAFNIPPLFAGFFPVIDVDVDLATVQSHQVDYGVSTLKIPHRGGVKTLRLTVNDDINGSLYQWFRDWIDVDILNCGRFISCLNDEHSRVKGNGSVQPRRKILIERLNSEGNTIKTETYDIVIDETFSWNGSQASEAQMYTVSFYIVKDWNTRLSTGIAAIDAGFSDLSNLVSNSIFG